MQTEARIAEIEAQISALEARRGTKDAPVALDAQIGLLKRTLAWHEARLDPSHYNTGHASLYERTGRSKRTVRRFPTALDYPAVSL